MLCYVLCISLFITFTWTSSSSGKLDPFEWWIEDGLSSQMALQRRLLKLLLNEVLWPEKCKIFFKKPNFQPPHLHRIALKQRFLCLRTETVRQKGVADGLGAFSSSWKLINHPSTNIMLRLSVITHGEHIPWQNFWFRDLLALKSLWSVERNPRQIKLNL